VKIWPEANVSVETLAVEPSPGTRVRGAESKRRIEKSLKRERSHADIRSAMQPEDRRKAGHYEVLGETYAKFEFFQEGWNPYSRFLDVDKVDLILRRTANGAAAYREVQVKFGKLYPVTSRWERSLFDVTSWRFFKDGEFEDASAALFVAYVLSEDDGYRGDFFIFPARDFASIIRAAPLMNSGKRRVYISRCRDEPTRWLLRRQGRFEQVTDETCMDVSAYRRNFEILDE